MSTKSFFEEAVSLGVGSKAFYEKLTEALENYTNQVLRALAPIKPSDHLFIIASLRHAAKILEKMDPEAARAADALMVVTASKAGITNIPGDTSESEIEQLKEQIYGGQN